MCKIGEGGNADRQTVAIPDSQKELKMKLSKEAKEICLDYGHSLMLTNKEILRAIDNMTEEEFCNGAMYEVLSKARQKLNNKWFKEDLRVEY